MQKTTTRFLAGCTAGLAAIVIAGAAGAVPTQDRPLFAPGTSPAPKAVAVLEGAASSVTPEDKNATLASGAASQSFMDEVLPTAAALGGTLLVIVLARSAVKRFGGNLGVGKRPSGVVEILARYPVARGQQVILLKVGRRVIVAHQNGQAMQALSEFSTPEDVADIMTRCEAGARGTKEFSFDSVLRQSGKAFDAVDASGDTVANDNIRAGAETNARASSRQKSARIDPRDTLPAVMRDAEIETVDLTRRGGGRR